MAAMLNKETMFKPYPPGLLRYLFFTYGYHVQDLIEHEFFKNVETDFREMRIHHILTVCLYAGFMFGNLLAVGTVIAWFHDLADILVSCSRVANCTGYDKTTALFYFPLMMLWIHTRCIILPIYIYNITQHYTHPEPSLQPIVYIETVFLVLMCTLHYFWLVMLSKIGWKFIVKGVFKDTLNNVDKQYKVEESLKKS